MSFGIIYLTVRICMALILALQGIKVKELLRPLGTCKLQQSETSVASHLCGAPGCHVIRPAVTVNNIQHGGVHPGAADRFVRTIFAFISFDFQRYVVILTDGEAV